MPPATLDPPPRAGRASLPGADGVAIALLGVAAATAVIGLLDGEAPVISLGVLYVLPVLLVATRDGALLASVTALLSVLAYNWFHLAPTGRLALADSRHWAVVVVLLVVAVAAARIAERGRRDADRAEAARREADLVADLTRAVLLGGGPADASRTRDAPRTADASRAAGRRSDADVPTAGRSERRSRTSPAGRDAAVGGGGSSADLDAAARLLSAHLGVPVTLHAWTPGEEEPESRGLVLDGPTGPVGVLRWSAELHPAAERGLRERTAPALAAAVAAAAERERLAAESVDAAGLRRANEVATTLLRTVGHDLRTPLTQISLAAAALRSSSLSPEERDELVSGIGEGADRLGGLLGDLLDLSRLEAGATAPRPGDVPLDDLVRDVLDAVARAHPDAPPVRLETEDPPPRARIDATQVTRIVANLVENALLHGRTPATGRADVLVRVARRRGHAVVRVVDGGPGLPPVGRDELFLPFRRGGAATGLGSGLGLAIARGLAEANGGTLRVESYPGKGTAFVLELPPAEDAADTDAEGPAGDPADGGPRSPGAEEPPDSGTPDPSGSDPEGPVGEDPSR